jgi:peptidoglycan hydrolase-like protein with peptidoglycan-binding domain
MPNYLQSGDHGPEVRAWQTFLVSRKIAVNIDEDFGPLTVAATSLWQKRAGVPQTGVLDDATLDAAVSHGLELAIFQKPVSEPPEVEVGMFDGSRVDRINAAKLARVCPVVAGRVSTFISLAYADGVELQIVQGLRSFAEQNALYAQGRTAPGKRVTNAKGGQSMHNYGLAVDCAPILGGQVTWDDKRFMNFGKWADAAGLAWGGRWRSFLDLPHVEDSEGMKLGEIQRIYAQGGIAAVWARIK